MGKTVVCFLSEMAVFYADTGKEQYSGTGRNRHTTRLISQWSNYQMIPGLTAPTVARGSSMKLVSKGAEVLAAYWADFGPDSTYEVLLDDQNMPPAITTKSGEKTVGVVSRSKTSQGTLVLLPNIDFAPDEFFEGKDLEYSEAAHRFSARLIAAVVALDRALRSGSEVTPEPSWASHVSYQLDAENQLRGELLEAESAVELAQQKKESILETLAVAGSFRALLYEKGKPLESAIIGALRCLGFDASNFKESDSEFDVVFESVEGRLIGEAEGKDNKAVNIEKLRQLAMNIQEDFQRDEVVKLAKPVLFGNGFRLLQLIERGDPFTEKCHIAAKASSTALVFTPDLFLAVQYLQGTEDQEFARLCREALVNSSGRVVFPASPNANGKEGSASTTKSLATP